MMPTDHVCEGELKCVDCVARLAVRLAEAHEENESLRGSLEEWRADLESLSADNKDLRARLAEAEREVKRLSDHGSFVAKVELLRKEQAAHAETRARLATVTAERDRAYLEIKAIERMRGQELQDAGNRHAETGIRLTKAIDAAQREVGALREALTEVVGLAGYDQAWPFTALKEIAKLARAALSPSSAPAEWKQGWDNAEPDTFKVIVAPAALGLTPEQIRETDEQMARDGIKFSLAAPAAEPGRRKPHGAMADSVREAFDLDSIEPAPQTAAGAGKPRLRSEGKFGCCGFPIDGRQHAPMCGRTSGEE